MSNRLVSTCRSASGRRGPARRPARSSVSNWIRRARRRARPAAPRSPARPPPPSSGSGSGCQPPDSMRERSSRSSTSRCIRRALARIISRNRPRGLGVGRSADQRLGVARDRGERGLEFVRDVGHEVPAHRLQPAQLGDIVQHQHRAAVGQRPGVRPARSGRRARARGPAPARPASTASTTSRAALTRNSCGRSGSGSSALVAQQPPRGRIGGDDRAPAVGGDHPLDHRLHQRGALGLLAAQLVEALGELRVHLAGAPGPARRCRGCRSGGSAAVRPRRWRAPPR